LLSLQLAQAAVFLQLLLLLDSVVVRPLLLRARLLHRDAQAVDAHVRIGAPHADQRDSVLPLHVLPLLRLSPRLLGPLTGGRGRVCLPVWSSPLASPRLVETAGQHKPLLVLRRWQPGLRRLDLPSRGPQHVGLWKAFDRGQ
jgi:hypothetical protein